MNSNTRLPTLSQSIGLTAIDSITALLHRQAQIINHKRVQRLMHELNLVGKRPQQRCRATNSNHNFKRYPNWVDTLSIERPN